jgi:hypothetical protein
VDNDIFKRKRIILSPEYQAISTSSELAPPPPSPLPQESVPLPPLNQRSQYGRLEGKRGTLYTLCVLKYNY